MRKALTLAVFGGLAVAACSSSPTGVRNIPAPPVAATNEVDTAFDQLMRGDQAGALKRLTAVLKRDPMNANAQLLRDSITRDPKDLLGPQSHPYTVGAGDTMVMLAERFLGNRLKAYQLLRYNGMTAPSVLTAGQVLRIPGEAPRPGPVRAEPTVSPTRPTAPPKSTVAKPKPAPAAPAANPAAARQLRTAGLAALNQGAVARAVGLLRRAAQLDPGNPVIAHDLARAERIAATVRTKK